MQTFSLDYLKRQRSHAQMTTTTQLTPEILGIIAICAVTLHARSCFGAISSVFLDTFFLNDLDSAPQCIKDALHVEYSVGTPLLREETEMALGAQQRSMAGRLNPDYNELQIKLHNMEAMTLLDQFELEFPEAVTWIVEKSKKIQLNRFDHV